MKFGVGDFSGQRPPGSVLSHRDIYARLLDEAELIEEAGLDSIWVSEHHFAADGYMGAVLPILAALLARTDRITVATDRLAASLYDPVRLAEDTIALDLLGGGRFILGLSLCYRDEEFAGFGLEREGDVRRFEALVPLLRAAFAGRALSSSGPGHRLSGVRVTPGPHTSGPGHRLSGVRVTPGPHTSGGPRVMIAADGEDGAARAARLADILMVDPTEPWHRLDQAVADFDRVRGDRRAEIVVFVYGALSEKGPKDAWLEVRDGFRYMRHNYDRWMGRPLTRELPPAHYRLLLGTPSQVADQAGEYRRRYGDRVHLVLRCDYPGMAAEAVDSQLRLWGAAASLARMPA